MWLIVPAGTRGAQHVGVDHSVQVDVVDESPAAGEQARIVDVGDAGPDERRACRLSRQVAPPSQTARTAARMPE